MKEIDLYEQIALYLNLKHPGVLYHFDLSGVNNTSWRTRTIYSKLNKRGFPDLTIFEPSQGYHGLFIEIKLVQPFRRDGTLKTDNHLAEQQKTLQDLAARGYKAVFACGLDQVIQAIEDYFAPAQAQLLEKAVDNF